LRDIDRLRTGAKKRLMKSPQATTMTALVKHAPELDSAAQRPQSRVSGFGLAPAVVSQTEQLRRAVVTMLLVLYPAMATAAIVIAALAFSGAQPIV